MPSLAAVTDPSTRERVAAVAAPLFAERGFAGVSMRDIAQAVGVKAASLYNHYPDKETLYFAALSQVFARRVELVERGLAATGTPGERLHALVSALVQATAGDAVAARLLQRELLDGDVERFERLVGTIFGKPFAHMTGLLNDLSPGGDGAQTAAYLIALIHGYSVFTPIFRALDPALTTDPAALADSLAGELIARLQGRRP